MGEKLSVEQVAEKYQVGVRSLRRWIADGWVPAYKIGPGCLRLDADEVERELFAPERRVAKKRDG